MKFFRPAALPSQDQSFQWTWLSLVGPDARDFLHRLSTVQVKALGVGEGAPGCFLTPQGKLRASFQLWRSAAESFDFEFDAGREGSWKKEILSFIDQYTFSERMSVVEPGPDSGCIWLFPEASELAQLGIDETRAGHLVQLGNDLRVGVQRNSEFGRIWLTLWGPMASVDAYLKDHFPTASELKAEEVNLWRILQLRPRVGFELVEGAAPLEIGMRNFIADQKGCYPGQEVIEKIISIGSPPRRLVRIETQGSAPQVGEPLLAQEGQTEIGVVTSVSCSQENQFQVLALVKKMFAKEGEKFRFSSSPEKTALIVQIASYESSHL